MKILFLDSLPADERSVNIVVISPDTILCPATVTTGSKVSPGPSHIGLCPATVTTGIAR
jgi:hypothetical protein